MGKARKDNQVYEPTDEDRKLYLNEEDTDTDDG